MYAVHIASIWSNVCFYSRSGKVLIVHYGSLFKKCQCSHSSIPSVSLVKENHNASCILTATIVVSRSVIVWLKLWNKCNIIAHILDRIQCNGELRNIFRFFPFFSLFFTFVLLGPEIHHHTVWFIHRHDTLNWTASKWVKECIIKSSIYLFNDFGFFFMLCSASYIV